MALIFVISKRYVKRKTHAFFFSKCFDHNSVLLWLSSINTGPWGCLLHTEQSKCIHDYLPLEGICHCPVTCLVLVCFSFSVAKLKKFRYLMCSILNYTSTRIVQNMTSGSIYDSSRGSFDFTSTYKGYNVKRKLLSETKLLIA